MSTPWYALNESQGFLWTPSNTKAHSGIDLATADGRPITAPFDAVQISQGTEPWGGQENILVRDSSGNYEVLSWLHMSSEQPLQAGTPIHAGDLLGYSGTPPPGYGSGPHIHFEETAGKTPPYMASYNPWYPTATSYPVNPQPVLNQLKSSGEGGTIGAPGASSGSAVASVGFDPFGIGAAFSGFEQAVQTDVGNVQNTIADGLKRIGVFIIGAILMIVGLIVIFGPAIEDMAKALGQEVGGLSDVVSEGVKAGTGNGSKLGLGGKAGLADLAEAAA